MFISMQLLSDSPGGLSRMKETGIEFFPSFWAVAQCHGSAAGGKKFKPENAIELESVRHCSAHKLYIHWWLQNFAEVWTEAIVLHCPRACCLDWDSIRMSYRTPKLKTQYTKACLQEIKPSFFYYQCGVLIFNNNSAWVLMGSMA